MWPLASRPVWLGLAALGVIIAGQVMARRIDHQTARAETAETKAAACAADLSALRAELARIEAARASYEQNRPVLELGPDDVAGRLRRGEFAIGRDAADALRLFGGGDDLPAGPGFARQLARGAGRGAGAGGPKAGAAGRRPDQ